MNNSILTSWTTNPLNGTFFYLHYPGGYGNETLSFITTFTKGLIYVNEVEKIYRIRISKYNHDLLL